MRLRRERVVREKEGRGREGETREERDRETEVKPETVTERDENNTSLLVPFSLQVSLSLHIYLRGK